MMSRAILRVSRGLVLLASLAVPAPYRGRFREEWLGELWHDAASGRSPTKLLLRAAGAFSDARSTRPIVRKSVAETKGGVMSFRELRLALRSVRQRPAWSLVVLLTLAVGIGANVAIFSLVEAVLLRPLVYPDGDRLVAIVGRHAETGERANVSPADFYDLSRESQTLASAGAHGWVGFFTVTGGDAPERVPGSSVTAGFLETLGVQPALGRAFTREDDENDAPPTVILTHAFWQRRFGGRPQVLGEMLEVDGVPHEILGVLPEDYRHTEPYPDREPALYRLYRFDRSSALRSGRFLRGVGRLAEGRSIEEARAELDAIASRLEAAYPESNTDRGLDAIPLSDAIAGDVRGSLFLLFGAVGAVWLVGCANLANLQLAHRARREQSLAVQAALGAGRGRLVGQLATESVILAVAGAALGLLLAYSMKGFLSLKSIPRAEDISFGAPVVLFTFGLAGASSLLFGLLPALKITAGKLQSAIVEGGGRGASARGALRSALIGAEVALSLVLLAWAGLFMKSLTELREEPPGFEPDQVLTFSTSLPLSRYPEGTQIPFYRELERRIESLSGVSAVGAVNILPLNNNYSTDGFQIEARPAPEGENPAAEARSVSPGYFEAMGIPLLRGRLFDERDRRGSPGVAIVSEAMAQRFWPGEDPIGERITYNRGVPEQARQEVGGAGSREIVGIVGNVKHLELEDSDVPMFYTPQTHDPSFHDMSFVVRTSLPAETLVASVRAELSNMDEQVPIYSVRALRDLLDNAVSEPRLRAWLLGLFAAVALGLAGIGVYGVVGLVASQRSHEIGIRMALGAKARDVVRLLVTESMAPVLWGLAAGLVGAAIAARLLQGFLFGVRPYDPSVYVAVCSLLAAAAFVAALLPALRASRIDPVETLRD